MATISEYMPKPNSVAATFVHHTVGIRIMRTSTSGCSERSSIITHATNSTTAAANRPSTRGDVQPQFEPSLTAEQQRHQPARQRQRRPRWRRAPGERDRRLGDQEQRGDHRDRGHHARDPEQPVVREVVDDRAGRDDREARADPDAGRDQPDRAGHPLARQLVADDAEREREDGAAAALHDARQDHHGDRRGGGGHDRAGDQRREHDHEDLPLAEHVAAAGRGSASRRTPPAGSRSRARSPSTAWCRARRPIVGSAGTTSDCRRM